MSFQGEPWRELMLCKVYFGKGSPGTITFCVKRFSPLKFKTPAALWDLCGTLAVTGLRFLLFGDSNFQFRLLKASIISIIKIAWFSFRQNFFHSFWMHVQDQNFDPDEAFCCDLKYSGRCWYILDNSFRWGASLVHLAEMVVQMGFLTKTFPP